jgi:hypothetical protein
MKLDRYSTVSQLFVHCKYFLEKDANAIIYDLQLNKNVT